MTTVLERPPAAGLGDEAVSPARPWPARLLVPVAVGLVGAGLLVNGDGGLDAAEVVRALLVLAWAGSGAALLTRPGLWRLGALVAAAAALGGAAYLACAAVEHDWRGAAGAVAQVVRPAAIGLLPAAALVLALALPDGVLAARGRRVTAAGGLVAGLLLGAALWAVRPELPAWWLWLAGLVALVAGLPAAHGAYRASAGLRRQRLQWLGCAAAAVVEVALVVGALRLFAGWPARPGLVAAAATALLPLALAVGVSARLVTRVDRLLVHIVSLAGVTGVVVAVYLVIVVGLGRVPEDAERHLLVLSMAAAAVAALLYLPTRERLSELANRLVYGEREAPDEVLRTFGSRLSRAIPMDELLLQLAESLRKTMGLTAAEVWTGTAERLERSVSVPERGPATLGLGPTERPVVTHAAVSGNAWATVWLPALLAGRDGAQVRVAPISHSGELLGLIVVERPGDADWFTEEDDRVLAELARQVALALHNVQLDSALQATLEDVRRHAEELRASRARIVATADAERRRIERNLHDGAQQHLVALAINLRLAKDLVAGDPETAAAMLDELAGSVRDTVQELRDLAHGIYPPLLMDSGLPEALRAAANRCPLDVAVRTAGVGRYGPEVEAAVYFCCLEALQNAVKHAPGANVELTVWEEGGRLRFLVADDGPGFDTAALGRGHGFVNMGDRLGAFGGSTTWESAPGAGTRISGEVPLPSPAPG